jgi:K+-sensing histidine kinase KdpD
LGKTAANAFPSTPALSLSLASQARFHATAAEHRREMATARRQLKEQELRRSERFDRYFFLIFWLIVLAAIVISIKVLNFNVDFYGYFVLFFFSIIIAALAASIITSKNAFDIFKETFSEAIKRFGQK